MTCKRTFKTLAASTSALCLATTLAQADIVHLDDVIIDGSLCVGQDCVNGESFGFDTIRLKENNTRIKFDDTSASASFPNHDWQLTANESTNGGLNKFSIEDTTAARIPFTIEGSAPTNSLYVDDGGRVGLGTSTPVVELHVVNGDSPTLRLEQNGSSGFQAQTWDVAGNETNFFVRDATNGSLLPFKIRPTAPSNSLYVNTNGDIGLGTASPDRDLHLFSSSASDAQQILLENTAGGAVQYRMESTSNNNRRIVATSGGNPVSQMNFGDTAVQIFGTDINNPWAEFSAAGLVINGSNMNVPDYVFEAGYQLMPLTQVQDFIALNGHLPDIPSAATVRTNGLNMGEMQLSLLRKVEELTLYTLDQEARLTSLSHQIASLTD